MVETENLRKLCIGRVEGGVGRTLVTGFRVAGVLLWMVQACFCSSLGPLGLHALDNAQVDGLLVAGVRGWCGAFVLWRSQWLIPYIPGGCSR